MRVKPTFFYTDKPAFGLDIGHSSFKVMQLSGSHDSSIVGYGSADLDPKFMDDGVITDPRAVAKAVAHYINHNLEGKITTDHVAMGLPDYRAFTRAIQLPKLSHEELREAAQLEMEQYVPVPLQDLYLDYTITAQSPEGYEIFVVAVPKKIVDSYLVLANMLGLKPILIEPAMSANARFFSKDKQNDYASALIDFGSMTANISIFNKSILTTGTVAAGGLVFTEAIRQRMGVSLEEAGKIKTKYGLDASKMQRVITEALQPSMEKLITEIHRMLRYYEERYGSTQPISQIVIMGGGSNMPGLGTYLTDRLKMPVRTHNHPWAIFDHRGLKLPIEADRLMFATVAGLALLNPKEVFNND